MADVIIIKRGEDLSITNSITIGSNINAGLPGMIIYNNGKTVLLILISLNSHKVMKIQIKCLILQI